MDFVSIENICFYMNYFISQSGLGHKESRTTGKVLVVKAISLLVE